MPKKQLLAMGLLSKIPTRSKVLQRFIKRKGKHYTDRQKMHMTALYHTPGISKSWMADQFESYGMNPKRAMETVGRVACAPKNKARWGHLGQQNIQFLGPDELQRYISRAKRKVIIPPWAIPILNDHVKQGMKQADIARKYGISAGGLNVILKTRSMFETPFQFVNPGRKPGEFRG